MHLCQQTCHLHLRRGERMERGEWDSAASPTEPGGTGGHSRANVLPPGPGDTSVTCPGHRGRRTWINGPCGCRDHRAPRHVCPGVTRVHRWPCPHVPSVLVVIKWVSGKSLRAIRCDRYDGRICCHKSQAGSWAGEGGLWWLQPVPGGDGTMGDGTGPCWDLVATLWTWCPSRCAEGGLGPCR